MAMITDDGQEWLCRTDDVLDSVADLHPGDRVRALALDLARAGEIIAALRADVDYWRTLASKPKNENTTTTTKEETAPCGP